MTIGGGVVLDAAPIPRMPGHENFLQTLESGDPEVALGVRIARRGQGLKSMYQGDVTDADPFGRGDGKSDSSDACALCVSSFGIERNTLDGVVPRRQSHRLGEKDMPLLEQFRFGIGNQLIDIAAYLIHHVVV